MTSPLPRCACGCGRALPPQGRKGGRPRLYLNRVHMLAALYTRKVEKKSVK